MERDPLQGHQVVCSAFIEKDHKVLIGMYTRFKVWRVPGGRPEYEEKIEDTLIRELQEETGIHFVDPKFLGWGQDQQLHIRGQMLTSRLIMFFYVKTDAEIQLDPGEAEDSKWVTIEELKQIENKEGALTDFFERNLEFNIL